MVVVDLLDELFADRDGAARYTEDDDVAVGFLRACLEQNGGVVNVALSSC